MAPLFHRVLTLGLSDFKRHIRLPFEVPPGVAALRLVVRFDPPGAGEVRSMINFSLFGPDGFVGAGHRHGTRHEAVIGPRRATPGFLPGPVKPGVWALVLHTHMVADATRLEMSVELLDADPEPPVAEAPLAARSSVSGPWMLGDLHCHSSHSDARWTVRELAEAATRRGLAFLALTDHNTTSGRAELADLAPRLLQLPGVELTTFYGHATALGLDDHTDWTGLLPHRGMSELAAGVAASGGLFTIAHPFELGDPVCTGCAWTYFDLRPEHATHLEVWNGPWAQVKNERALAHWYELLAQGRRVLATVGTDAHGTEYLPGHGFTCTPHTDDPATLLAQLRAGTTYLSRAAGLDLSMRTPSGPASLGSVQAPGRWEVTVGWPGLPDGCTWNLIVDGTREQRSLSSEGRARWPVEVKQWFNLEIRLPDGELYLLTNPVWAWAAD